MYVCMYGSDFGLNGKKGLWMDGWMHVHIYVEFSVGKISWQHYLVSHRRSALSCVSQKRAML